MVGGGKVAFTSAPPLCRFDTKLLVRRGRIADQQAGRAGLSGVPGSGRGYSCAWWWWLCDDDDLASIYRETLL
jgi:hypothetical protein